VNEGHGIVTGCIVGKMTQLSPDQAEALPRSLRP
jgi:hypothetical protein